MSLNSFLGKMAEDNMSLSKPFLYDVQFMWGDAVPLGLGQKLERSLRLLCHQANIPGFEVASSPIKIYGLSSEMPYELIQHPINLTFYVDKSFKIPEMFFRLRNYMFDENDYSPRYKDQYQFDGQITIYSTDNFTPVAKYIIQNAFVKSISDMTLDYGAQNQFQQVSVTISYDYIRMETIDSVSVTDPYLLSNSTTFPINADAAIGNGLIGPVTSSKLSGQSLSSNITDKLSKLNIGNYGSLGANVNSVMNSATSSISGVMSWAQTSANSALNTFKSSFGGIF